MSVKVRGGGREEASGRASVDVFNRPAVSDTTPPHHALAKAARPRVAWRRVQMQLVVCGEVQDGRSVRTTTSVRTKICNNYGLLGMNTQDL